MPSTGDVDGRCQTSHDKVTEHLDSAKSGESPKADRSVPDAPAARSLTPRRAPSRPGASHTHRPKLQKRPGAASFLKFLSVCVGVYAPARKSRRIASICSASVGDAVTVMVTAMVSGVWRRRREFLALERYLRLVGRRSASAWGPQPPGGHVGRRVQ